MKRLIAIVLLLILLPSFALADKWFPFMLTAKDTLETASAKLEAALPEIQFEHRAVSISARNIQLYIGDLTFTSIVLLQNAGAIWRLVLMTGSESPTYGNITAVYDAYKSIVELSGQPTETSPKIIKRHFDGSQAEYDIFSNIETFSEAIYQTGKATRYVAQFGDFCTFECEVTEYFQIRVTLMFANYAES